MLYAAAVSRQRVASPKHSVQSNAYCQPIVRDGSGLRFRAASVIVDRNKIIETEERPYSEAQGPSRVYFHFMYRGAHYTKETQCLLSSTSQTRKSVFREGPAWIPLATEKCSR